MISMSPKYGHQTVQQIALAANQSFKDYLTVRIKLTHTILVAFFMVVGVIVCSDALAAYPTQDTVVGDVVTNPATGEDVIVVDLILDPPEAGTDPPETTYVNTSDDYFILVKNQVGDLIYFVDESNNLATYKVVATDEENGVADLQLADDPQAEINPVPYAEEKPIEEEGEAEKTEEDISVSGVRIVSTAPGGKHGSWGTLFIPPTQGKRGTDGYPVNYANHQHISTTDQIGIEAGSIGGNGGGGGDSYGSFWDGKRGGDGGKGGKDGKKYRGKYEQG